MNWIGLARSLQAEIIGTVGALLIILGIWLFVRVIIGRSTTGAAQARFRSWTDRGGPARQCRLSAEGLAALDAVTRAIRGR